MEVCPITQLRCWKSHRVVRAWRPTRFFGRISYSFRSFFFYSASPRTPKRAKTSFLHFQIEKFHVRFALAKFSMISNSYTDNESKAQQRIAAISLSCWLQAAARVCRFARPITPYFHSNSPIVQSINSIHNSSLKYSHSKTDPELCDIAPKYIISVASFQVSKCSNPYQAWAIRHTQVHPQRCLHLTKILAATAACFWQNIAINWTSLQGRGWCGWRPVSENFTIALSQQAIPLVKRKKLNFKQLSVGFMTKFFSIAEATSALHYRQYHDANTLKRCLRLSRSTSIIWN